MFDAAFKYTAILDIGSNSFHFVLYKIQHDNSFTVEVGKRIVYRLGETDEFGKAYLSESNFIEAKKNISELNELAATYSAKISATATSAVREAENKTDFLRFIKNETGIEIELLSGEREAELIYKAAKYGFPADEKSMLCVDIGGGSTELIFGKKDEILFMHSFRVGAVRLTKKFFKEGIIASKNVAECRNFLVKEFELLKPGFLNVHPDIVSGNSGTICAVTALAHNKSVTEPFILTQKRLTKVMLSKVIDLLLAKVTPGERKEIPFIEVDRADILPAGALILEAVFEALTLNEMVLSDYSVREGKLLEILYES